MKEKTDKKWERYRKKLVKEYGELGVRLMEEQGTSKVYRYRSHAFLVAEEDVRKMLDDARKDFPRNSGFGFNEDGTKIYDVFDWFKQWFGRQKK